MCAEVGIRDFDVRLFHDQAYSVASKIERGSQKTSYPLSIGKWSEGIGLKQEFTARRSC
jgi:hypothetical protein